MAHPSYKHPTNKDLFGEPWENDAEMVGHPDGLECSIARP